MSASTGWCCKAGWNASRTTIFLISCQWGAIASKSVPLPNALGFLGFRSSGGRLPLPWVASSETF